MLRVFIMMLVVVMIISVAGLVVEHVALLAQIRLCEIHHLAVDSGTTDIITLAEEIFESLRVVSRLRHGMVS